MHHKHQGYRHIRSHNETEQVQNVGSTGCRDDFRHQRGDTVRCQRHDHFH
ncbi:Uncharacterised protein [Vibrio cholerae]|nr:Uncharacterised protein [Vibrio cholerae]CSC86510.1 Uncharacterised protein [Vibrio cholerae]CSI60277.1 Uncharacterised protein [Vibrio cholerae]CSI64435.1 Uncharacterised protein [Vibrio cholerae]